MISEQTEQGRRGQGRLNGMILVSLLFHAALLSLLFFSPSLPSPKLTFGPVYTVALVSFSAKTLEQKAAAAGAKELMETGRSATVLKKRLEAEPLIPIQSRESRKKQDQTLEKAMEEIRKRAAAAGPTPKTQPKTGSDTKAMAEAKAGPASPLPAGDADMNAKINAYTTMIKSRIFRGWTFPQGILPGGVKEPVIVLTILRSGAVTEVNFKERSGNRFVDDSVQKAIWKASPFPPLPVSIGGASEDVEIRFDLSKLRP